MTWSWKLGQVAGIGIFVHWTFLILIGWVALQHAREGAGIAAILAGVGFVLAVFACVVLHELGHALTARRYHIPTRDITLLPIGGVARLERMPDDPRQELWIAAAGPAVNIAIAAVLFGLITVTHRMPQLSSPALMNGGFASRLLLVNLSLVAFNLLPAFPMDGGRVLRALLARRLEYARATRIAAGVGQFMAIVFGFIGLTSSNPVLVFIALFVFLGAQSEASTVQTRVTFRQLPVREAMMTRFTVLRETDSLATARDELIAGAQQDFPVVRDGRVAGLLTRTDLVKALRERGIAAAVGEVMRTDCPAAQESEPLDAAYDRMRAAGCSTLAVVRDGRVVGVLTLENIGELMMVRGALGARG